MGKIDRAALRQRIQTLEGLTDEERAALLELAATKRYGLVWEEREEEVEERLREELPVLVEDKELALTDGGKEAPNHILIEGDNLEALTTLSYTHEGKVDVIYIDPPYNTGNKDFVYNDSFVDSEDSYRHSKWLSFMSKRLRIAKRLLSDRGVIFISIDDNEQANLKLLCDEVFGEKQFCTTIVWEKSDSPKMDTKDFSNKHDFIIAYYKDRTTEPIKRIKTSIPEHYNKTDRNGNKYYLKPLRYMGNADSMEDRPSMYFPVISPDGSEVYPIKGDGGKGRWRWSKEKVEEEKDKIEFIKTTNGWSVYYRIYADKDIERPAESIWYNEDVDGNRQAIAELKYIFGDAKIFTNPKPTQLIKRIVQISSTTDSTILDFFAGSGTTLHAVMQLNKEDGGRRQCILVTNNENNICREVTYERNRRVIEGYTTPKGTQVEGLHDNNLRYYRTRLLPRERTNRNMRQLVAASTDLLCIKEGIYSLTPNPSPSGEGSRMLTQNDVRIFSDGQRAMMVIYNKEVIPDVVEWIQTSKDTKNTKESRIGELESFVPLDVNNKIKVYVFSPGAYAWDDDFAPVLDRVELCALPEAIYQAYKSVLPKKKVRRESVEESPEDADKK